MASQLPLANLYITSEKTKGTPNEHQQKIEVYIRQHTCSMFFLLDNSSSNLEIFSIRDLLSSINFFLWTRDQNNSFDEIKKSRQETITWLAWPLQTSRCVSLLRLMSNIASACFSERLNSGEGKRRTAVISD